MMLEAKNVSKVYPSPQGGLPVLKNINLKIPKGELAAIVGPSGAGKSTLLHILGGLDSPSEGSVLFQGQDLRDFSPAQLCRMRNQKCGFIFQFYHLLPEFTVEENVLMPSRIAGKCAQARARELLSQLGLDKRLKHFPSELSGGEKQRAAIARALINQPEALFCDEPTGNLDSRAGGEIGSLIKKINLEQHTTVVLVTHNQELTKIADRVYYLRDGALVN